MFKMILQKIIERKVARYIKKHKPLLVVVTGSVGKTSTKYAIATVLSEKFRVRAHLGNHSMAMSAPLAIVGIEQPEGAGSFKAWREVLKAINLRINEEKDVDVIVQELDADAPGAIAAFERYLRPDIAVVTAVSEEHMGRFGTLEAVAREVLSVAKFSELTVVNRDDVDAKYASFADTHNIDTYGIGEKAEYRLVVSDANPLEGRIGQLISPEWGEVPLSMQLVGDHSLKAAAAAACVGAKLGLTSQQVAVGVSKVKAAPGRMRVLRGQEETTLIDDTYSASPLAVEAALKTLYAIDAPMRVALLGSMNGLDTASVEAHKRIGKLCDAGKLDWVVTIGEEAKEHLATAAAEKGCQVKAFIDPYSAGSFVHSVLKPGAVVLAKGSSDGVFAEEALKILLHSTDDEEHLVRQSAAWLEAKRQRFAHEVAED